MDEIGEVSLAACLLSASPSLQSHLTSSTHLHRHLDVVRSIQHRCYPPLTSRLFAQQNESCCSVGNGYAVCFEMLRYYQCERPFSTDAWSATATCPTFAASALQDVLQDFDIVGVKVSQRAVRAVRKELQQLTSRRNMDHCLMTGHDQEQDYVKEEDEEEAEKETLKSSDRIVMCSVYERIVRLLEYYSPYSLASLEKICHHFKDRESELLSLLIRRYGREPLPLELRLFEGFHPLFSSRIRPLFWRRKLQTAFCESPAARLAAAKNKLREQLRKYIVRYNLEHETHCIEDMVDMYAGGREPELFRALELRWGPVVPTREAEEGDQEIDSVSAGAQRRAALAKRKSRMEVSAFEHWTPEEEFNDLVERMRAVAKHLDVQQVEALVTRRCKLLQRHRASKAEIQQLRIRIARELLQELTEGYESSESSQEDAEEGKETDSTTQFLLLDDVQEEEEPLPSLEYSDQELFPPRAALPEGKELARLRVTRLLSMYAPQELGQLDDYLAAYTDREDILIETLVLRLGPEAPLREPTPRYEPIHFCEDDDGASTSSPEFPSPPTQQQLRARISALLESLGETSECDSIFDLFHGDEEELLQWLEKRFKAEVAVVHPPPNTPRGNSSTSRRKDWTESYAHQMEEDMVQSGMQEEEECELEPLHWSRLLGLEGKLKTTENEKDVISLSFLYENQYLVHVWFSSDQALQFVESARKLFPEQLVVLYNVDGYFVTVVLVFPASSAFSELWRVNVDDLQKQALKERIEMKDVVHSFLSLLPTSESDEKLRLLPGFDGMDHPVALAPPVVDVSFNAAHAILSISSSAFLAHDVTNTGIDEGDTNHTMLSIEAPTHAALHHQLKSIKLIGGSSGLEETPAPPPTATTVLITAENFDTAEEAAKKLEELWKDSTSPFFAQTAKIDNYVELAFSRLKFVFSVLKSDVRVAATTESLAEGESNNVESKSEVSSALLHVSMDAFTTLAQFYGLVHPLTTVSAVAILHALCQLSPEEGASVFPFVNEAALMFEKCCFRQATKKLISCAFFESAELLISASSSRSVCTGTTCYGLAILQQFLSACRTIAEGDLVMTCYFLACRNRWLSISYLVESEIRSRLSIFLEEEQESFVRHVSAEESRSRASITICEEIESFSQFGVPLEKAHFGFVALLKRSEDLCAFYGSMLGVIEHRHWKESIDLQLRALEDSDLLHRHAQFLVSLNQLVHENISREEDLLRFSVLSTESAMRCQISAEETRCNIEHEEQKYFAGILKMEEESERIILHMDEQHCYATIVINEASSDCRSSLYCLEVLESYKRHILTSACFMLYLEELPNVEDMRRVVLADELQEERLYELLKVKPVEFEFREEAWRLDIEDEQRLELANCLDQQQLEQRGMIESLSDAEMTSQLLRIVLEWEEASRNSMEENQLADFSQLLYLLHEDFDISCSMVLLNINVETLMGKFFADETEILFLSFQEESTRHAVLCERIEEKRNILLVSQEKVWRDVLSQQEKDALIRLCRQEAISARETRQDVPTYYFDEPEECEYFEDVERNRLHAAEQGERSFIIAILHADLHNFLRNQMKGSDRSEKTLRQFEQELDQKRKFLLRSGGPTATTAAASSDKNTGPPFRYLALQSLNSYSPEHHRAMTMRSRSPGGSPSGQRTHSRGGGYAATTMLDVSDQEVAAVSNAENQEAGEVVGSGAFFKRVTMKSFETLEAEEEHARSAIENGWLWGAVDVAGTFRLEWQKLEARNMKGQKYKAKKTLSTAKTEVQEEQRHEEQAKGRTMETNSERVMRLASEYVAQKEVLCRNQIADAAWEDIDILVSQCGEYPSSADVDLQKVFGNHVGTACLMNRIPTKDQDIPIPKIYRFFAAQNRHLRQQQDEAPKAVAVERVITHKETAAAASRRALMERLVAALIKEETVERAAIDKAAYLGALDVHGEAILKPAKLELLKRNKAQQQQQQGYSTRNTSPIRTVPSAVLAHSEESAHVLDPENRRWIRDEEAACREKIVNAYHASILPMLSLRTNPAKLKEYFAARAEKAQQARTAAALQKQQQYQERKGSSELVASNEQSATSPDEKKSVASSMRGKMLLREKGKNAKEGLPQQSTITDMDPLLFSGISSEAKHCLAEERDQRHSIEAERISWFNGTVSTFIAQKGAIWMGRKPTRLRAAVAQTKAVSKVVTYHRIQRMAIAPELREDEDEEEDKNKEERQTSLNEVRELGDLLVAEEMARAKFLEDYENSITELKVKESVWRGGTMRELKEIKQMNYRRRLVAEEMKPRKFDPYSKKNRF